MQILDVILYYSRKRSAPHSGSLSMYTLKTRYGATSSKSDQITARTFRSKSLHRLRQINLNERGVSLVEVLAVSTIIVVIAFGVNTMLARSSKMGQANKQVGQLQAEHEALRALILSIPAYKAGSIICQYPHPYMDYQESTGRCLQGMGKTGPIPTPKADDLS